MKLTAEELGKMLYEELVKDEWGDIEVDWFNNSECGCPDCEGHTSPEGDDLRLVLKRVVARINRKLAKRGPK